MATVELIAELHEIKESMCDAVRHVPEFIAVQQKYHYHSGNPYGKTWTNVGNVTKEFECFIQLCVKGNALNIEIKKFKLKEKIPIAQTKLLAVEQATTLTDAITQRDDLQKEITDTESSDIVNKNIALYKDLRVKFMDIDIKNAKYVYQYGKYKYPQNLYPYSDDEINVKSEYVRLYTLFCNLAVESSENRNINHYIKTAGDNPITRYITHTNQITEILKNGLKQAQQLIDKLEAVQKYRDTQATTLHTRLTALIDMIPVKNSNVTRVKYVKKIFVKKELTPLVLKMMPQTPTLAHPQQPNQQIQPQLPKTPKSKTHQISLENCELRNLQSSDYSLPITNLDEFNNTQFYFRKSEAFRVLHLHCVGPVQYLVGADHKLYVFMRRAHSTGGELVHGTYFDKLQCWTL